jgi:ABC-2 type transport system ATP-binding protein
MKKLLEIHNISKSFRRLKVLENISLNIQSGSIVAVTGENGSGKSTLLNMISGWINPDKGSIRITKNFGFCPQEPLLFSRLTVNENLEYFMTAYGGGRSPDTSLKSRADALLKEFDFYGSRDRKVGVLSGGTKQKLNLVISLLNDPDLMIMDEPYASLDWDTYNRFWDYALQRKKEGRSLLIVSHFMYGQSYVDELYAIKNYQLVCV